MTSLCLAVEKGNIDIVNLLLTNDKLDIDIKCIFIFIFLKNSLLFIRMSFQHKYFNFPGEVYYLIYK